MWSVIVLSTQSWAERGKGGGVSLRTQVLLGLTEGSRLDASVLNICFIFTIFFFSYIIFPPVWAQIFSARRSHYPLTNEIVSAQMHLSYTPPMTTKLWVNLEFIQFLSYYTKTFTNWHSNQFKLDLINEILHNNYYHDSNFDHKNFSN